MIETGVGLWICGFVQRDAGGGQLLVRVCLAMLKLADICCEPAKISYLSELLTCETYQGGIRNVPADQMFTTHVLTASD